MGKLSNYLGSVELASGVKGKNDNDIPLMEAHSVAVSNDDGRLDELLNIMIKYCRGLKDTGSGMATPSTTQETDGYACTIDIEFSSLAFVQSAELSDYAGFNATPTVTIDGNIVRVSGFSNFSGSSIGVGGFTPNCTATVSVLLVPRLLT